MSWRSWEDYGSGPIRRADGIKAQTQRGKFGQSWWAGRWIAALERLVDEGRLSRGRSYARRGQVLTLDVGPEGVAARVQGSRPKPYQVSIHFRSLSDADWEQVIDRMAVEVLYAAKLLSGEMPREIEEVFTAAGVSLFPASTGDLQTECSCPDWSNPCKHVAAVHYLLGERFDADPFLIFELRGRSKAAIIAALRARRAGAAELEASLAPAAPGAQEAEEPAPLRCETAAVFWSLPATIDERALHFEAPPLDAVPVLRLGRPSFWSAERDFAGLMEQGYRAISDHARRLALGEA